MSGKYENEYLNRQLRETEGKIDKRFQSYLRTEDLDKGYIDVPIDRKNKDMDWLWNQFPIDESSMDRYDPIFGHGGKLESGQWGDVGRSDGTRIMVGGRVKSGMDKGTVRIPIEEWKDILIQGREISLDIYEKTILEDYSPSARKLRIENKIIDSMKDKDKAPWDTTNTKYKEGQ